MIAVREALPTLTPEEYFAWEEQQLDRHEYIDGHVYAMSGGTINHSDIAGNFLTLLKAHMRGSGCKTLNSDARVRILESNRYVYPDISVTCDRQDQTTAQYITYPCLIVEVLSPMT
jgi:Uma2 family endonuclease